ncbi:hypothetical protein E2C01_083495 [Portunus trituberculatus]|uniref:Uncharacterized protein n=1 Tax=Portunus trituberculatus TaxID=210409 RepID=A0A5B7ISL3_PORTR|nr:hypothetical protein [Portunus trituberculatus]
MDGDVSGGGGGRPSIISHRSVRGDRDTCGSSTNGPKVNASPYSSSDKGTRHDLSSGGDRRDQLRDSSAVSGDQECVVSKFFVCFFKIHHSFFSRYAYIFHDAYMTLVAYFILFSFSFFEVGSVNIRE